MDYVHRRGKTYCAVIPVPADLQEVIGKRQIWRSLKTKCYSEARSASRKLLLTVDVLFQQARESMDGKLIDSMVAQYGLAEIAAQDKARLGVKVSGDPDYNEFMLRRAEVLRLSDPEATAAVFANVAEQLRRDQAKGRRILGHEAAYMMLGHYNNLGLVGGPDEVTEDEVTEVVAAFATAERHLFKVESERMQGITEDDSDYQHRLLGRWRANLPVIKDLGIPLSDFFDIYAEGWAKSHRPDRVGRKKAELKKLEGVFAECFGAVPKVKEVTAEMALEWREYYQHAYNDEREPLTNKTVDNATETMSAVYNEAIRNKGKFAETNPFRGLGLPKGVKSEKSRIFEPNELQGYVDLLTELHNSDRPELTWIPLVMAFSGMRCNEVAQLFVDDIMSKDGIDYFRVTDNKERNQRVKTEESKRNVPIHSTLVGFGLMRYAEKMRDAGHEQLFPNCKYRESVGLYYDANLSSLMNEPVNLISEDRKLRMYSLRANFRCSIEEALIAPLLDAYDRGETVEGTYSRFFDLALDNAMGHKVKGNTGDTVYRKRQLSIMNGVVQMAAYPVDFSRLKAVLTGLPCAT